MPEDAEGSYPADEEGPEPIERVCWPPYDGGKLK